MQKDYITPEQAKTIPGLFLERVKRSGDSVAVRQFDEVNNVWFQRTWNEVYKIVACWQSALENEGLRPGDRVAIMVRNSMEWMFFDIATLATGLVVVPIYLKESHNNFVHMMNDSGARLLIVEDWETWNGLAPVHDKIKDVIRVLIVKPYKGAAKTGLVRYINDWVCHENLDIEISEEIDKNSPATLVYTSGTTGLPKGVLLTHNNIIYDAYAGIQYFDVFPDDLFLSFLPLTHMFERTAGYYIPIMAGSTICYARSVKTIAEDLLTQKPTLIITVPLVLQRIYEKVMTKAQQGPSIKKAVFQLAMHIGKRRFLHAQGRATWRPALVLWPLLYKLVGSKVLEGMGGRIRTIVSGGAPLAPEIWKMFVYLGIPIIQGYGMTEVSPVLSVNKVDNNMEASVGLPLIGTEIKIGANGEVLTKGPATMLRYWNNEAATKERIDKDGWLHTGDVGELRDGHLFITDRLKQIIVMSNGEKVPPEGVEMAIKAIPLFGNVMIYGEKRPYIILLAEVNPTLLEEFARTLGVPTDGNRHMTDPKLLDALVQKVNA
jgi:long-chain acyl-CoA synthetase